MSRPPWMAVWDRLVPFEFYFLPSRQNRSQPQMYALTTGTWCTLSEALTLDSQYFAQIRRYEMALFQNVPEMIKIDIQRGNQSVSLFSRPHIRSIKYLKVIAITANTLNFALMAK